MSSTDNKARAAATGGLQDTTQTIDPSKFTRNGAKFKRAPTGGAL